MNIFSKFHAGYIVNMAVEFQRGHTGQRSGEIYNEFKSLYSAVLCNMVEHSAYSLRPLVAVSRLRHARLTPRLENIFIYMIYMYLYAYTTEYNLHVHV